MVAGTQSQCGSEGSSQGKVGLIISLGRMKYRYICVAIVSGK